MPCRADCECLRASEFAGGNTCDGDYRCAFAAGTTTGLCAPGAGPTDWPLLCACTGGTCDDRMCCVQADGTVANAWDPPCLPPNGGQ